MANRAKITADLKKELDRLLDETEKKISKADLDKIGQTTVNAMKDLIEKGISPIQGKGRFPGYLRPNDTDGYPTNVRKRFPKKRARPVNLTLSGKFLKTLIFRSNSNTKAVEVGFFDQLSLKKEQGHRDGAQGQPERPIIPKQNESLVKSIVLEIEDVVTAVLKRITK